MAKLDIDTLLTPRLSVQFVVVWALAAAGAIVVGVLPALWINSHRADASASASADEPVQHMSVSPIEAPPAPAPAQTAEPTVPEPTVPAAAAQTETAMPAMTVSRPATKPSRPKAERTKPASSRTTKREACDVYLHPHGCPR